MRTPAGKECSYFYGNYHRGHNQEECRLLQSASPPLNWTADLCSSCPVPEILMANACPNLVLKPRLERLLPFVKSKVKVGVACDKTSRSGFDPHVGCGECHPLPPEFKLDVL
jgi:hypothetical protein